MQVTRKTVLVTGASRGIGAAIAHGMAKQGFRVAIHYNASQAAAQRVYQALEGNGHILVQGDLAEEQSRSDMFEQTIREFGRLDVLVNNAGVFEENGLLDLSREAWRKKWRRTLAVNLDAAADLTFFAAQDMAKNGQGRIINITSRGAFRGEPRAPEYGAAKAGLNSLSQSFAQAFAPHGVLVFALAPGFVETEMAKPLLDGPFGDAIRAQSPLNRAASVSEMAEIVTYLATQAPAYMTGAIIDANGASYLRN